MNKKLFGIKIGTTFTALISLIVAVFVWFYVEYNAINSQEPTTTASLIGGEAYDVF